MAVLKVVCTCEVYVILITFSMQEIPKPDDLLEQLRAIPTFQDIDATALHWMIDRSKLYRYEVGELMFRTNEPVDYMWILLEGEYVVRLNQQGRKRELGAFGKGTVTGILPFSRMKAASANGPVTERCDVLALHRDYFVEMVNVSYELSQALVGVMTNRVREFQHIRMMDEKLLALGKMSAGLAHELN
ncbi:MAG: cyclic nucleotide-binding domain-containing protein, partial [Bacteroidota bacterium]